MPACSAAEFDQIVTGLDGGVPDAGMFQLMSSLTLDVPAARLLAAMDPFSVDYRQAALDLYLGLRAHPEADYVPRRDEAPSFALPEHIWSQLPPWSFRDPGMVGEHLYAWGHILRHLVLPPGGSVLEYGPGSGQILLMLARLGYRAHGADVDAVALEGIRLQAEAMQLEVSTERAVFGDGFGAQRFDTIIFYEAFHHALDFQDLLRRLHDRLNPGGRVILCGEPVVPDPSPGIPYPWGPRLDALSVFCMRRFGWMELGFTHGFFTQAARRAGWSVAFHPFPGCGRAHLYVLEATMPEAGPCSDWGAGTPAAAPGPAAGSATMAQLRAELMALHASTSWKVTRPLRTAGRIVARLSRTVRPDR
nr:class I SAM-dependent methyltransferase [uncultured Lichenicoccus sp.]